MINKTFEKTKKIAIYLPETLYIKATVRAFLDPSADSHYSTFNAYVKSLISRDIKGMKENGLHEPDTFK